MHSIACGFARLLIQKKLPHLQLREEGGISASISRLQGITSEKSGSSEELVALFVALLRAAGLLVRFVRYIISMYLTLQVTSKQREVERKQIYRAQ